MNASGRGTSAEAFGLRGWVLRLVAGARGDWIINRQLQLLAAAISAPAIIGGLVLWGQRYGLYGSEVTVALLVTLSAVMLCSVICFYSMHLGSVQREARDTTADLECRIHERAADVANAELRSFQLLEHLPVGVFVLSGFGQPVYANQMSKELLGKGIDPRATPATLSEVYRIQRKGTTDPYPPDELPVVRALRGEDVDVDDVEILHDDHSVLLEVRARALRDPQGAIRYAVASFSDITDRTSTRRLLDERSLELDRRSAHLERANNDLEQFTYVASHDLQEPLRMVASYVRLLKVRYHGQLDADAHEMIDFAEEGAVRLKGLITDLQTYARVGRGPEVPSLMSVRDCVDEAIAHFGPLIRSSGAHITCEEMPRLRISRSQLTQVFECLIDNALKFHGASSPEITVSAERAEGAWVLAVGDNGMGIHPQHADRIFVIFQRLNGREAYSGNGMGLALCKKIVERYDGRIWVESELGHGAIFRFTLPDQADVTDFVSNGSRPSAGGGAGPTPAPEAATVAPAG